MRRCWVFAVAGVIAALPAQGRSEGFEGGRDQEMTFRVIKSPRNSITMDSKAPRESIKGVAKEFTGEVTLNPARLESATGSFTVPFKNLDTGNKMRNQHMLASDWINADQFPDAVLTITGIKDVEAKKKARTATLTGKMAMHGVEKDVEIPVTLVYTKGKADDGSKDTLAIQSKFEIKLADYEIKGKAGVVGSKVAETLKMTVSTLLGTPRDEQTPKPARPTTGGLRPRPAAPNM